MNTIIHIRALKDNYIWLIVNQQLGQALVVDPGDAAPVVEYLKAHDLQLVGILVTHKHADHTGGISELVKAYPHISVYAHPAEKVALATHEVKQNDVVLIDHWQESCELLTAKAVSFQY